MPNGERYRLFYRIADTRAAYRAERIGTGSRVGVCGHASAGYRWDGQDAPMPNEPEVDVLLMQYQDNTEHRRPQSELLSRG